MKSKKRATSKPSKQAHREAEASCKQLGEDFLAELEASWRRHGRETLERIRTERPKVYFKAMVRLTEVVHRRSPEPPEFDRHRARADVLQRVQRLARKLNCDTAR
jgi:hypothetical protein